MDYLNQLYNYGIDAVIVDRVARVVQARSGLSLRAFLRLLRPLRSVVMSVGGREQVYAPQLSEEVRGVLEDLRGRGVEH